MKKALLASAGIAAILLALAWTPDGAPGIDAAPATGASSDTRQLSDKLRDPHNPASLFVTGTASSAVTARQAQVDGEAMVGDQASWIAINDTGGFFYDKVFELRATNALGEVWIAVGDGLDPTGEPDGILGLNFPAGDCRNDGVRNVVTDAQAAYLLEQFTSSIKPTDETWFGEPLFRDGSQGLLSRPSPAGKQVVLVDNVRDDNFYDTNNVNVYPFIAGFFTSAMDFFHNRNVQSIDGFDWLHRTAADPPHQPSPDPCTSAPARPFLYEAIFAHEYQHLLHNDYDPDELAWVNEGMSDLAMFLNGYSDPAKHVDEKGNDSHIVNIQGWASVAHPDWNPIPRPSGPENSLTAWGDQGDVEILEDYGFVYSFMLYLVDHGYGQPFFTAWQHNPLNGIEGLNDTLAATQPGDEDDDDDDDDGDDERRRGREDDRGPSATFQSLFDDLIASMLLDAYLDEGADLRRGRESAFQSDSLNSTIFFSGNAYDTPGAPPWGADYLPLGQGKQLKQLQFDGDDQFFFPGGNDWTVDPDGYWTNPDQPGLTIYPAGLDSSIARRVDVPAGAAGLTFEHWYQTENSWDFGFVQVLSGGNFVSLPCTGTTVDHNPSADPTIVANVPGYTGPTDDPANPATAGTPGAPLAASCDLSAYAGQSIVLSFRLMTDPLVEFDGWHVRNAAMNGAPIDPTPADLTDWDNQDFFTPVDLAFELTLVGVSGEVDDFGHVDDADRITVVRTELGPGFTYTLPRSQRNDLKRHDQVIALVTGLPEDENDFLYFPYSLKVNGQEAADGANIP